MVNVTRTTIASVISMKVTKGISVNYISVQAGQKTAWVTESAMRLHISVNATLVGADKHVKYQIVEVSFFLFTSKVYQLHLMALEFGASLHYLYSQIHTDPE